MPSVSDHKEVARVYFEDVLNRGDFATLERICNPAVLFHDPFGDLRGPEQLRRTIQAVRAAFPDLHYTVEEMVAEGQTVAVRSTIRGTQRGELAGIAPTGRSVTLAAMQMLRFSGGRIEEGWAASDLSQLYRQLGVSVLPD